MKLVYFVSVAGEKKGPFGVAELRRRFEAGEFPGGSLYWREGWAEWRKLNELSEDALIEMLVTAETGAPRRGTKSGSRRWHTWIALAGAVLAGVVVALWTLRKFEQSERQAQARELEIRREMAETIRVVRQESEALVAGLRRETEDRAAARRSREAILSMDEDARLLAGAAQQYFMESANTAVAVAYDPNTGAIDGPLAQYIRRISPGYAVVPRQLKLEGVFRMEHPDVGPARHYHEDGRRAVEEP